MEGQPPTWEIIPTSGDMHVFIGVVERSVKEFTARVQGKSFQPELPLDDNVQ
jgi:hypothetical protein